MKRIAMAALLAAACAPPKDGAADAGDAGSADDDAGQVLEDGGRDAGHLDAGIQCTVDGGACWEEQTYCDKVRCQYDFSDAPPATCGDMSILPLCFCSRDPGDGGLLIECLMGCLPYLDGGGPLDCVTPNCGSAYCVGTRCTAQNHCE